MTDSLIHPFTRRLALPGFVSSHPALVFDPLVLFWTWVYHGVTQSDPLASRSSPGNPTLFDHCLLIINVYWYYCLLSDSQSHLLTVSAISNDPPCVKVSVSQSSTPTREAVILSRVERYLRFEADSHTDRMYPLTLNIPVDWRFSRTL